MTDRPVVLAFPDRQARFAAPRTHADPEVDDVAHPHGAREDGPSDARADGVQHGYIVFVTNACGQLAHASDAFHEYTGARVASALAAFPLPAVDARDLPGAEAAWAAALDARRPFTVDLRLIGADLHPRWFRVQCAPTIGRDGRLQGWAGACVGIEDLKREQAMLHSNDTRLRRGMVKHRLEGQRWREMQTGLAHVAKLSAVGHVATTLAHELNQPLTAASIYATSAVRALQRRGPLNRGLVTKAATDAVEQVLRAGAIVRNLRDVSLTGSCQRSRENLRTVIEEAIAFALIGIDDLRVSVVTTLDEASHVLVNRIQIQQVLINLIRNAVEAMEGLHTRGLDLTLHGEPGNVAVVCVADTGTGLADGAEDRLFSPCVSGKPNGMGIGLSISRTIVEAHGGAIWAEHRRGGGAVVKFTLPLIDDG